MCGCIIVNLLLVQLPLHTVTSLYDLHKHFDTCTQVILSVQYYFTEHCVVLCVLTMEKILINITERTCYVIVFL
jgi:hypothetical protein